MMQEWLQSVDFDEDPNRLNKREKKVPGWLGFGWGMMKFPTQLCGDYFINQWKKDPYQPASIIHDFDLRRLEIMKNIPPNGGVLMVIYHGRIRKKSL